MSYVILDCDISVITCRIFSDWKEFSYCGLRSAMSTEIQSFTYSTHNGYL